ncbi:MAG: hypothetical protein COA78_17905 [Blastopirellula sp.]|nr:MAG: hypothetical protein COA78_17905 [Blastopirellula sp.]
METENFDNTEDIVLDDKPREDGLEVEQPSLGIPDPAVNLLSPQLEQLIETLPVVLDRLDKLTQNPTPAIVDRQDESADLIPELMNKFGNAVEKISGFDDRLENITEQIINLHAQVEDFKSTTVEIAEKQIAAKTLETTETEDQKKSNLDQESTWEILLLGSDLCHLTSISSEREKLMDAVKLGHPAAIGLVGHLMLMQIASDSDLPPLLKEIGESYYRWKPKKEDISDSFEEAIVNVLHKRITEVGLRNTIEIARPGDRYDASRHLTSDRGIEVTVVHGWSVLRENRKTLTKAAVSLR